MKTAVEFDSNGSRIRGMFYCTEGEPLATALLLHGLPGNEEDVSGLGQRLVQHGASVLTFNYRGTFQSEGVMHFGNALDDTEAALAYLRSEETTSRFRIDLTKLILGGHSYGGGMALIYAAKHPEVRRLVSVAGADHGEFARGHKRNPAFAAAMTAMFAMLKSPSGPLRFGTETPMDELLQNPDHYDLRLSAATLADRKILLVGGWDDINTSIEHHIVPFYRALMKAGAQKVEIVALRDDHAFTRSREELAATVLRWILSQ